MRHINPCLVATLLLVVLMAPFVVLAQNPSMLDPEQRLRMLRPVEKRPVTMVLDTDTFNEIDDQFALVYALLSPELRVEAVYAAPFHNSRSSGPGDGMEKSHEEIVRILKTMGLGHEGFAFRGSTDYLRQASEPHRSPAALDLVGRAQKHSSEDPLYVVAVGAITNVASAILIDPEITRKIVVVWLGGNGHDWRNQREFNFQQDLLASRLVFDSGVPLVQLPCTPVVTHFATTVPEMERYLAGQGETAEYLLKIFKEYRKDHFGWSKVLWDMTAVAWLVNPQWLPSNLVHTPIVTDQYTFSFDRSRHFMRAVYHLDRDGIFRDFFRKVSAGKATGAGR
jgi:purine nucleosidase